ncbi:MAG TPA: hypothetical protein VED40_18310 [Azospirillaceae bacterium]|nr:hypothetical protein [Azospirillaceae bacterium]
MPSTPAVDAPVLRVRIETEELPTVDNVASILGEIGKSFDRYARRYGVRHGLRLVVQRIYIGSLIADLVVIGTATTLTAIQHREAIYGFVGFLSNALSIAQGIKKGENKTPEKRLVNALHGPVANGEAQQVNIFIVGDSNSINIDKDSVKMISNANLSLKKNPDSAREMKIEYIEMAEEIPVSISTLPAAKVAKPMDGKYGTAFNIKGQWYVRLEGEGGVLNPAEMERGVTIEDGRVYKFNGSWEGRRYRIKRADPSA